MGLPKRQASCHPERPHEAKDKCSACYLRTHRRYRARVGKPAPPSKALTKHYNLKRYGLTLAEYESMLAAQGGLCAICEKPLIMPHVDHNHDTSVVRALLCQLCNMGIGAFHHSPNRLVRAAEYLDNHDLG